VHLEIFTKFTNRCFRMGLSCMVTVLEESRRCVRDAEDPNLKPGRRNGGDEGVCIMKCSSQLFGLNSDEIILDYDIGSTLATWVYMIILPERYPPTTVSHMPPYPPVHSMHNCSHTLPRSNDSKTE
jgi:hypothetical protein